MARVFVSYASEDLAVACKVHDWLVAAGHEVFLAQHPRDGITTGEPWRETLHERLRRADAVVCVITSAAVVSCWCNAEIATAWERGSRLLPLLAEPGLTHPLLPEVQHTDMTQNPAVAHDALIAALRRIDSAGGSGWPDDRSPFPGLRPFDSDRHRVFFGRADEIKQLAEHVRSAGGGTALLVVGPSGCGKSSLVRAGLVPVMAAESGWRVLPPILPGADPVGALARELAAAARRISLDWTVEHVRHRLGESGFVGLADELLLADPAGPQQRMLIVVDQFEELLTQTTPTERARFTELLRPALTGPVRVVATLRPEFLGQLLVDPELAVLPTRTYTLRPLRREALRAVIEKPARLAGINVDDGLVDRLVDDTDSGEALPLLAFTLAQLADSITLGGRLSTTRYDQLGGVQGALTRQADAALTDAVTAGRRSREQVIAGLLRLVTVDEQGRPTRWRVLRNELPTPVITELDVFVECRLLTTDEGNGSGRVGVAHEAFLSAWPPLAQAITAAASALRARRAVEHAATEWHDNGRPPAQLWGGGQLAAAVTDTGARIRAGMALANTPPRRGPSRWVPQSHRVLVTDRVDLGAKARDFLHASIRHDRYRRRRTTTILSVLLVFALVAGGFAVNRQRIAEDGQRIATARQLVVQADATRRTDLRAALLLGLAAHRIHPDGATHSSLLNTLTAGPYAGTLTGHRGSVDSIAFGPDGHTLATGSWDKAVILWDLTDRTQPRRLGSPLNSLDSPVGVVAFAPQGHLLAAGSLYGTTMLWDLTDRAHPLPIGPPLAGHAIQVRAVAFAPDGRTLATGGNDSTAMLWDLTDPVQPQRLGPPLTGHSKQVSSVAFAPDGRTLATGSWDKTSLLWDLADPAQPHRLGPPLTRHSGAVPSVAFAPDGRTLATGSVDGTAILWDLTDRAQPRQLGQPLTGHKVSSLAFSPDGRTLATGSADATAILWDLTDRSRPRQLGQPLTGHLGSVRSVAFSPDGHTLATGSFDTTVILWNLTDPARPHHLGSPLSSNVVLGAASISNQPVFSVAFSSDGRTLAVGSFGVILWDLTDLTQPRRLGPPLVSNPSVWSVAFTHDGHTLAAGSLDGTVTLWDLTDRNQVRDQVVERACSATHGGLDRAEWKRYVPDLPYQNTCPA